MDPMGMVLGMHFKNPSTPEHRWNQAGCSFQKPDETSISPHWSKWIMDFKKNVIKDQNMVHGLWMFMVIPELESLPMTDPNGAAIYGVPWIPSTYPKC